MNVNEIIKIYKMQSTPLHVAGNNGDYDLWWKCAKIKLTREDLIKVLKFKNHMDGVIPTSNLDSWYALNSWSDLVSLMDCCLGLNTDSYLNTIY